mgnify:CR=1 FL=1|tara:strand:+ start:25027 stop:25251 length:225 start_codon:yes stop_codon:yes gene_type:complete
MSVLRVNNLVNNANTGVVTFSKGMTLPAGVSVDGAINLTGVCTATSFVGSGANITVTGGVSNAAIFALTFITGS